MKKYVYLFLLTLAVLAAILMSGYMLGETETEAEVVELSACDMDNTITSGGKLQYKSGKEVKAETAGILDSIYVKNGDTVQKGDELFSYYRIDDAYLAAASAYSGAEGIASLLQSAAAYTGTDELLSLIKSYCPLHSVRAERSGTVSSLKISPDDFFEKNASLLRIADRSTLEIPVHISENQIEAIHKGQRAQVRFSALPDKTYQATVTSIAKEASVTGGLTGKETTVEVILTLQQSDSHLRVGYTASCSIVTSTDRGVLVLPYDCIRTDSGGDYVYTVRQSRARKTYIHTGTEYKSGAAVSDGLSAGDVIVRNGESMSDGRRLKITNRAVTDDA